MCSDVGSEGLLCIKNSLYGPRVEAGRQVGTTELISVCFIEEKLPNQCPK